MLKLSELEIDTRMYSIKEIVEKIKDGKIKIKNITEDKYLNNYIITNILARIPLDNVYVYRDEQEIIIMDSKVITAINNFVNDRFKYESNIDGISDSYFSEMPNQLRRRIMETYINLVCINKKSDSGKEFVCEFLINHKRTII